MSMKTDDISTRIEQIRQKIVNENIPLENIDKRTFPSFSRSTFNTESDEFDSNWKTLQENEVFQQWIKQPEQFRYVLVNNADSTIENLLDQMESYLDRNEDKVTSFSSLSSS